MRGVSRLQKAGEAGGESRADGHGEAIAGNRGCVNPGNAGLDGKIVNQEAGFKIISSIEDEVAIRKQFLSVLGAKVGNNAFSLDPGIDGAQLAFGGYGLRQGIAGVRLIEQGLSLEVGRLDEVPINDFDRADARANEQVGG